MSTIYDIPVTTIDGQPESLAPYRGQVLLIVNVASRCSFTPQYAGLEELYRRHKDQGFAVLGFPCDQFLHQEPGNEADIQGFCSRTSRCHLSHVRQGEGQRPADSSSLSISEKRKRGLLGTKGIKWNFGKFLVDRTGNVVRRYSMFAKPESIERDVAALL